MYDQLVKKMINCWFLAPLQHYQTPYAKVYLWKCQIRPKMLRHMDCAYPILALLHFSVQKRLCSPVSDELFSTIQPFSHRRNVTRLLLLYRYFRGKCSSVPNSPISTSSDLYIQDPPCNIDRVEYEPSIFPPYLICKKGSQFRVFRQKLPLISKGFSPEHYYFNLFKCRVNHCIPYECL